MKQLSEIKGERSFDILADLIEPVTNIASDKKCSELFGVKPTPKGMTPLQFILQRAKVAIPTLMKRHKKDLVKILALLSDVSEKEYLEQMTLDSIIIDLSGLMSDPIFNAFFTIPQSTADSSGSASENTEE